MDEALNTAIDFALSSDVKTSIDELDTQTANLDMGTYKITNVGTPTSSTDAATKSYVDTFAQGIQYIAECKTKTNGNISATYDNGTDGVGATLTASSNGAIGDISGYTIVLNDRVLVPDQTDAKQNGVYTVTDLGDGSSPYVLTRATDVDGDPANETKVGTTVYIASGLYVGNKYAITTLQSALTTPPNVTVGTDVMTWSQVDSVGINEYAFYFGGEWHTATTPTVPVVSSAAWYQVTGLTSGVSNVISQSSSGFTIVNSGVYEINLSLYINDGAGSLWYMSIATSTPTSGTYGDIDNGYTHPTKFNSQTSASGNWKLSLTPATYYLYLRNSSNTGTFDIRGIQFSIKRLS